MPKNLVVREIFGIILTFAYLLVIPPLFAKSKWGKKLIDNVGQIRYYIVIFFSSGDDESSNKDGITLGD